MYFPAEKHRMCTQKIKYEKVNIHKNKQNYRIHSILFWTSEMWLKFIVGNFFHVGGVSMFPFKVKVVENLISSGIEDHTFGPINFREHFPEEELTLGKNKSLEVASLVEW